MSSADKQKRGLSVSELAVDRRTGIDVSLICAISKNGVKFVRNYLFGHMFCGRVSFTHDMTMMHPREWGDTDQDDGHLIDDSRDLWVRYINLKR